MNIYKKTIVAVLGLTVASVCMIDLSSTAHSNASGAPAARTGSPGDGANCTSCHTGSAATTLPGLITSNVPVSGYIPGATYTITATISASGINKYGFEISPQSTTGVQKGTLVVTNATETRLIIPGTKYITHKSAGTAGTGTKTWTFDWIAPAAGSGDAIMYGAFVLANGNGANSGDQVRLSSLLIQENLTAGIMEIADNADKWSVYPNPSTDVIHVQSLDAAAQLEAIDLYDITGKRIKSINYEVFSENQSLDIADLQSGMYVLNIHSDKKVYVKKFVKR